MPSSPTDTPHPPSSRRTSEPIAALLLVCITFVCTPAHAEPLSLEDAVARGVAEHPAIEAVAHRQEAAEAVASQASSAWFPRVTVDAKYRFAGPLAALEIDTGITLPGGDPITIERDLGSYHFASVGATAAWRVYDFGSRDARTDAAQSMAEAAQLEGSTQSADIAYAVRASYLACAFVAEVHGVTERSLETARQDLEDRVTREKFGVGSEVEIAAARARVAELESRLVTLSQDKRVADTNLRSLLGLSESDPIELTDDLKTLAAAAAPEETASHPALERLSLLEEASQHQATSIERSFWPTLDVFATADYRFPRTFVDTEEAGINYAAGVSLSWLVFDGGLSSSQGDEAIARAAELSSTRAALADDIDRRVSEARTRWEAAAARIQPAEVQRDAAAAYLDAASGARKAGALTDLDVSRAQERLEGAGLGLSRAYFDQAMAHASWLKAQGLAAATPSSADETVTLSFITDPGSASR